MNSASRSVLIRWFRSRETSAAALGEASPGFAPHRAGLCPFCNRNAVVKRHERLLLDPSRTVGAPSRWAEMCHFRTFAAAEGTRAKSLSAIVAVLVVTLYGYRRTDHRFFNQLYLKYPSSIWIRPL